MISDEKVRVRFVTKHEEFRITDAPFSLPTKLGRSGLSEVINHLLNMNERPQPFDFMIGDHLIRSPLQKFLAIHRISTEAVILIDYFPATSLSDESESVEVPGWVGSIDTTRNSIIIAGCYDGTAKIFNSTDLSEISTISAHDDPVRAVLCWSSGESKKNRDASAFLATASKDHTVKCWDISNTNSVNHVATLSGHMSSVESLGVWHPTGQASSDTVLLTGDWAGTLFGWNVSQLSSGMASPEVPTQDKKKRKKASDFMGVAVSAVAVNTDLKPLFTIKAHAQAVSGICSNSANSGKNNSIFTCSWDHALKEWDLERQDCMATFASSKVVTSVDCSSSHSNTLLVATSHPDGKVRCWDPRQAAEASVSKLTPGKTTQWVSQVRWRPESALHFGTADYSGNVTLWDIRSTVPLGTNEAHSGKALCVDWLASESGMDVAGEDKSQFKMLSGGSDCCLKATSLHH